MTKIKKINKQIKESMIVEDNTKKTKFFNKKKELFGYYGDGKKLRTLYEK
jgi:hypothetical protein